MLPWSASGLSRAQWLVGERGLIPDAFPPRVDHDMPRHADGSFLYVLELGCGDGQITQELLSNNCVAKVTAVDGRKSSLDILAAQPLPKRSAFKPELELVLGDVEKLGFKVDDFSSTHGMPDPNLVVDVGLLYHLTDPEAHLRLLPRLAPRLLLDTHYSCLPPGSREKRSERTDQPRAGLQPFSVWLPKEDILSILREGYTHVEVVNDRQERNGRRMTVVAWHMKDLDE